MLLISAAYGNSLWLPTRACAERIMQISTESVAISQEAKRPVKRPMV